MKMIERVLRETWHSLPEELSLIPLEHWNESVFRFQYVKKMIQYAPESICRVEWNRIDLVVQNGQEVDLIEFKFFLSTPKHNLLGDVVGRKGGASRKNYQEFSDCINQLKNYRDAAWHKREVEILGKDPVKGLYMVLVYAHYSDLPPHKDFSSWYERNLLQSKLNGLAQIGNVAFQTIQRGGAELHCELIHVL